MTDSTAVVDLVRARPEVLGGAVTPRTSISCSHLGAGETYDAWLVNAQLGDTVLQAVVRVLRRPVHELPRPLEDEFAALALVPTGIGPRPIYLEADADAAGGVGAPFLVTTYVEGRAARPGEWNREVLAAHGRQLARLHGCRSDGHGSVRSDSSRFPSLSMVGLVDASAGWWKANHPKIADDPEVRDLIRRVRDFASAAEPAFERIGSFCLIHGDLVLTNILLGDDDVPLYIDWEWGEYGDPAQDLAYLGGAIATSPWHVFLPQDDIDFLITTYGEAASLGNSAVEDLRRRRSAWEVYERLFSSLHFQMRRDATPRGLRHYDRAVRELRKGLRVVLA